VSVKFAAAFIQSYEEDFFTTSPKVLYRATTESYSAYLLRIAENREWSVREVLGMGALLLLFP
jgi:hypothetical protein